MWFRQSVSTLMNRWIFIKDRAGVNTQKTKSTTTNISTCDPGSPEGIMDCT